MKYFVLKSILLLILSGTSHLTLADTYVQCNNCSNYSNYAKSQIGNVPGNHTVHVADFNSEVLSSFNVRVVYLGSEPGTYLPSYLKQVSQINVPSTIMSEFNQIIAAKSEIEEAVLSDDFPTEFGSPWALHGDPARQTEFFQWVDTNYAFRTAVTNVINLLGNIFSLSVDVHLEFSDGSYILLKFTRVYVNGSVGVQYQIDFENSKDANGNPIIIPEAGNTDGNSIASATFQNGSQTLIDFLAAAARAGIPVGYQGGGGGTTTCTLEGKVLKCIFIPT